jgi:hypothetical protein
VRALAERQVEAVGGAPALVAPVLLERHDHGVVEILGDLPHIMAKGPGHGFNHHRAVRFAAER